MEVKGEEDDTRQWIDLEIFNDRVCVYLAPADHIGAGFDDTVSPRLQLLQGWVVHLEPAHLYHVSQVGLLLFTLPSRRISLVDVDHVGGRGISPCTKGSSGLGF